MASRREPPERLPPGFRGPAPGVHGNPSSRAPSGPRGVHWEDRPAYLDSPPRSLIPRGGESPPYRYNDDGHRRFGGGESPPQWFVEGGRPPGYHHDSPQRRFTGGGRDRPFPHHMSPDDSPPHRLAGDPGTRYSADPPRRFSDGPPRRFPEDPPRRFAEGPPRRPGGDPHVASQFHDEPPSRFGAPRQPSVGYPGYRDHNPHFSDSESPSPPPGHTYLPPPPPPGGIDMDETFGGPHQPFGGFGDEDRSPPYHHGHRDEMSPRRYGVHTRRFNEESPPNPPRRYPDDPRRFGGAFLREFHDGSPPEHVDEPPRRFAGTPPRPPPPAPVSIAGGPGRSTGESPPRPGPRRTPPGQTPDASMPPRSGPTTAARVSNEHSAEHSENPPPAGRKLEGPPFSPQHAIPGVYSRDPTRTEIPAGSSDAPRYARPKEFSGGPQSRQIPGVPLPTPSMRPIPGDPPVTHFVNAPRPHSAGSVGFGEDLAGQADSLSPPRHAEDPFGGGITGAPLRRIPEGTPTPPSDDFPLASRPGEDPFRPFAGGARHRHLPEDSPPYSPPHHTPPGGIHGGRMPGFGEDLQSKALGEDLHREFARTPPRGRLHPDASPADLPGYNSSPGYNTPPGYLTPGYYTSSGYNTPQQFPATPPYHFSHDSPGYADVASPHRGVSQTPPAQQQHRETIPERVPPSSVDPSRIDRPQLQSNEDGRDSGALVRFRPELLESAAAARRTQPESVDSSPLPGTLIRRPHLGSAGSSPPGPLGHRPHYGSEESSPAGPPVRYTGGRTIPLRSPDSPVRQRVFDRDDYDDAPPFATPPREQHRPPPPGLGRGRGAPLLPEGFFPPRPKTSPPGRGTGIGTGRGEGFVTSPPPELIFSGLQKRAPDGYINFGRPRPPPAWPPGPGHDAIFTADVIPIELDEKLKQDTPHPGNPGSSTGGGWKDMWAAVAFVLHIAAITTFSFIFGFQGLTYTIRNYDTPNSFHISDWFPQLAAAAIVGAVFAFLWQTMVRMAPVRMILLTIWAGAALMGLFGIVLIATGTNFGLIGLLFLFVAVCQALYSFVVQERIPFAGEMLKKVISVCGTYPSTYVVSYLFVLVALAWLAIWIFGLSGSGIRTRHVLIIFLFLVSLGWTLQVLRNIVRVTVAGTVSLFYFQQGNMPPRPTYVSLIRACTFSIGSICFGSLVVPLVELPCHALRRINSQAGTSEFLFSCIVCMLACFDHLIRYFNRMGYIQVAIHGKPFIRASKDTWDMLRAQEVDVLMHDDLASTILFLACGIGGSLSAIVGGVYTFIAHKSLTVAIALISFAIGGLMTYVTMAVLESAISTYYVCFAEDPTSLQRNDGPLYERMWVRQMDLKSPITELTA